MNTNEAIGAAINHAASTLPDGWQIHVTIEQGAGWAGLYNSEGIRVDDFDDGDLDLQEAIQRGVELATGKICLKCFGAGVIQVRAAGAGHADDLAEYDPCECKR